VDVNAVVRSKVLSRTVRSADCRHFWRRTAVRGGGAWDEPQASDKNEMSFPGMPGRGLGGGGDTAGMSTQEQAMVKNV